MTFSSILRNINFPLTRYYKFGPQIGAYREKSLIDELASKGPWKKKKKKKDKKNPYLRRPLQIYIPKKNRSPYSKNFRIFKLDF